jgi:hypothetical protein
MCENMLMAHNDEFSRVRIAARIDAAAGELLIDGKPASNQDIADIVSTKINKNISHETIRRYRINEQWVVADVEKFLALAEALGKSPSWILFGEGENTMSLRLDLAPDEHNLLSIYRNLRPDLRGQLIGFAHGLLAQMPMASVHILQQKPKK